jgi:type I restriction enzyme S subunit
VSLPRYPEYKDSGVEWLGKVPGHWDVVPLKYVVEMRSGGTPSKERVDYWNGTVPWASSKDLKVEELHDTVDHVSDLAVHDGAAAVVAAGASLVVVRGMILAHSFPVVRTLRPMAINQDLKAVLPRESIEGRFLSWMLRGSARESLSRLDEAAHGTKALRMEAWTSIKLPIPPVHEQISISEFLDRETAKIDALVTEQERLVALLKEKRQAVISHAVTKGLNTSAPMQAVDAPWCTAVPAYWKLTTLGRVATSYCDGPFGSGLTSAHYVEEGVRVIRLQNIKPNRFDNGDSAFIDLDYYSSQLGDHDVQAGDVLIAGLGDDNNTVGRACVAPDDLGPAMVKADCFRFRLDPKIAVPEFVAQQLTASAAYYAGVLTTGSTRARISLHLMASRRVLLPPLPEQHRIVQQISGIAGHFDSLIAQVETAEHLLRQRRAGLITAAVTGQIDVRGLAPAEAA